MISNKKILCVVAHPDDEALGVGGTLIKHCQCADDVFIIILSEGEESKSDIRTKNPKRLKNAINWSRETGCNLQSIYKFSDQKLDSVPELELVTLIEKHVKSIKPNIVYTHFPSDLNKDHRVVSAATFAAIRPISSHKINPEIRTFETPSSSDQAPQVFPFIFTPNLYVNIEDQWKLKEKAFINYQAEIKKYPHPRSIKAMKALAIKRGAESGFKYAESFYVIRKRWI